MESFFLLFCLTNQALDDFCPDPNFQVVRIWIQLSTSLYHEMFAEKVIT
jgi:hypothetical protein